MTAQEYIPEVIPYKNNVLKGLCIKGMQTLDLLSIPFDDTSKRSQPPWRLEKSTRSRCTISFEFILNGEIKRIFAKRYKTWRWLKKLEYLFHPPKAFREWQAGLKLLEMGITTPQPLLYAVEKKGVFVKNNYLVTLSIEPNIPLSESLTHIKENEKRQSIIQSLGSFISRVHDMNFYHDDLSVEHIYIPPEYCEPIKFALIDIDNCRFGAAGLRSYRAINLFQILRSADEKILNPDERRMLVESYLGKYKKDKYNDFIHQINAYAMRKEGRKVI